MANSEVNPSKIIYQVPTLLSLVSQFIIDYEEVVNTLTPKYDWDFDNEHLFNQRLTPEETQAFQEEILRGVRSFTEVKDNIRAVLVRRPFQLDLVQLRTIPLLKNLPKLIVRVIWIEAILARFEAYLTFAICFYPTYRRALTRNVWNCVMDGCQNKSLLRELRKQERILVADELVEEWLLDNLYIDQ